MPPPTGPGPAHSARAALARLVDATLEATVALSFSRPGIAIRRAVTGWSPLPRIDGARVVITGGSSGIGLAAAMDLTRLGAQVTLIGRDAGRLDAAAATVEEMTGRRPGHLAADMAELAEVRRASEVLLADPAPIHALVHAAGAIEPRRRLTSEGIEATWATAVVGPFLMTELLSPALRAAGPGRVVLVSSGGMYTQTLRLATVDDLAAGVGEYRGATAYALAKRGQVVLAAALAAHHRRSDVLCAAMHPGWVDTPGLRDALPRFARLSGPALRRPAEGADTVVWLCTADAGELADGGFWLDRRRRSTTRGWLGRGGDGPDALWAWCSQHAGADPT